MNRKPKLTGGLDLYKATMGQVEYLEHPDAEVTFTLNNRAPTLLSDYVTPEELRERLDELADGWQPDETAYLATLRRQDSEPMFDQNYLNFLNKNPLPPVEIDLDERGDLAVSATGQWPLVTFWETVVMSELNELYFRNKMTAEGVSLRALRAEGSRRLNEKIALLQQRPDITVSDFGTRRRFGYDWHQHVVERMAEELPDTFAGTSNIHLARELGLKPIGTFAHELPMVYAALADKDGDNTLNGHNQVLQDWENVYHGDLSTALTDTFTTDFFFKDFTPEQAASWRGMRHDSGDPVAFGEKVIQFYRELGIDPLEKTIVFSDGLDIQTIIQLADHFKDRIGVTFGWGTTLTNDLGLKANNFVMKATAVDGVPTVKLSDVEGKHTGPAEKIAEYQERVRRAVARPALGELIAV